MTHDCDRATECLCYQAGYLNGQQTDEGTLAWLADSFELTAGRTGGLRADHPPGPLAWPRGGWSGRRWRAPAEFCSSAW